MSYDYSLTTFSPSGKLVQIEYALKAVESGAPAVGIKATNGVVLATEKKFKSLLYDENSLYKIEPITKHCGMVYAGMGPDYRLLIKRARKIAVTYESQWGESIPIQQLVGRIASQMQNFTQASGVRPMGVSLLICGWDNHIEGEAHANTPPFLYQCDPSGAYFAWKATALGKNNLNGKAFLERRYSSELELDDAVHTAILTLKESFEGQMDENNIEIGICDTTGFRRLRPDEVKDYLVAIA